MVHILGGGGGFIGINLAKKLAYKKSKIFIIDNLSNAHLEELTKLKKFSNIIFINGDLSSLKNTKIIFEKIISEYKSDITIWHLAANSNIPSGIKDPSIDLKDTFNTTFSLIEACKQFSINKFIFASSSAIYGDHGVNSISENSGPLMPISNYGAMKLASEALCFAARESYLKNLRIFRFPNVVGLPPTHGVIFDLLNKLKKNPKVLHVLGDGSQNKSYLHVDDLIDGMIFLNDIPLKKNDNPIFNLGVNNDSVNVKWLAEEVVKQFAPKAKIIYGESNKGWIGDIPKFTYNTSKAIDYGWIPKLDSKQAVSRAIKEIINNI